MAATVENYVLPSSLYRYRSLEKFDREIGAIEQAYVYCASFEEMNDPMEGLFNFSALAKKTGHDAKLRAEIRQHRSDIGLASFSETNDNELMWAHYANQFKGICIEYSFYQLRKSLPDDVEFVRLFYNEKVPTVGKNKKEPIEIAKRILSFKNYRWLYEREWRMFARRGRVEYADPKVVKKVHIGFRVEPDVEKAIKKRLKAIGIKTQGMSIKGYGMKFE